MIQSIHVLITYILVSVLNCAGQLTSKQRISKITKPLLMPLLIVYCLLGAKEPELLLLAALTAGFFGDLFLMGRGALFLLGLSSFFVGHLFYIAIMIKEIRLMELYLWMFLPVVLLIVYGILIYLYLKPHAGKIHIVLIPYILVLLALGLFAFVYFILDGSSRSMMVLAGALFFIVSDSLLSLNLFVKEKKLLDFTVMATYTLAQGLLAVGFSNIT